ncbi:MAG: DUF2851 family protein [Ignavibacteria bacterium]|jgi:hypothetical protein|nr:DUF2851 family protein [Ignavibacteria bacterium]MCU7503983.1 DUF2851 family protein [Ignavibacteria bacterium]MCU7515355.1 DUF2851 family protein [Ignavibacteria bacterium]
MNRAAKVTEKALYEVWKSDELKRSVNTIDGESVSILDTGFHNTDTSGPDFKNARIRIGNLTYVGDVEIDVDISDWRNHGHFQDAKYSSVILHVVFNNKHRHPFVFSSDKRKIPVLCITDFLDTNISLEVFEQASLENTAGINHLRCSQKSQKVENKLKLDFLYSLGISRFRKRCDKIYERLKELAYVKELDLREPVIGYDLSEQFLSREFSYKDFKDKELWQQLFYEFIFEALGYSNNKAIMLKLAQSANLKFLREVVYEANSLETIRACLFYISGLISFDKTYEDKEIAEHVDNSIMLWDTVKDRYDGKVFSEINWHFFKLRPQNFPTIRLAGGAVLLQRIMFEDMIGRMIKKFEEIKNKEVLLRSVKSLFIVPSDGFWKTHYVLDKPTEDEIKYFIGGSRIDDIIINIVLPYVSIYSEIHGNKELSKTVLQIFSSYIQPDNNNIVKTVASSLYVEDSWKRSILSQGMIELFRSFCSKDKCRECEIGKVLAD